MGWLFLKQARILIVCSCCPKQETSQWEMLGILLSITLQTPLESGETLPSHGLSPLSLKPYGGAPSLGKSSQIMFWVSISVAPSVLCAALKYVSLKTQMAYLSG